MLAIKNGSVSCFRRALATDVLPELDVYDVVVIN